MKLRSFVEIERWLKTAYPEDCKLHGIWLATLKEECALGSEKVIEATRLHLAAVNVSQAKSSTRPNIVMQETVQGQRTNTKKKS